MQAEIFMWALTSCLRIFYESRNCNKTYVKDYWGHVHSAQQSRQDNSEAGRHHASFGTTDNVTDDIFAHVWLSVSTPTDSETRNPTAPNCTCSNLSVHSYIRANLVMNNFCTKL